MIRTARNSIHDQTSPDGNRAAYQQMERGDSLILGWQSDARPTFGFARTSSPEPDSGEPVLYSGDGHLITVAPTGAGKGRGTIIPNLLMYQGPVVVLDPKGENYLTTARRRREMGHQVIKLDPFGVVDDHTDGLNPFDIFDLLNADLETDAQTLSELISRGSKGFKEPFWDLSGCGLHTGVNGYVAEHKTGDERNLNTVRRMLMSDDVVYNLAVVLDTVGKSINEMSHQEIATFLQMPELTRGGVLATAASYIKAFVSRRVARTLEKSSFNLRDVVDGKPLSFYLIIPPDKLRSHNALLKLWVGTLLKAITSRRYLPERRTLFLLDECGQLQNFPYLETAITLCRGYGLTCWTFWQDLDQIQSFYPESWKTLLHNCGVVQTFGIGNRDMAEQWSGYLDHDARQLRSMQPHEQVVQIYGEPELKCHRCDYLSDGVFHGRFDPNRFFMKPPSDNAATTVPAADAEAHDAGPANRSGERTS